MANEMRLIDANELVRFCENEIDKYKNWLNKHERDYAKAMCVVKKIARKFPTVDAEPVVYGRWLYDSGTERHFCSECNEYALSATTQEQVADYDWEENLVCHLESVTKEFWTDYCPNCGAKMDGERR